MRRLWSRLLPNKVTPESLEVHCCFSYREIVKVGRSRKKMRYHGRVGFPVLHKDEKGKTFIMVRRKRKEGGGTKKLYLVRGNVPKRLREKK